METEKTKSNIYSLLNCDVDKIPRDVRIGLILDEMDCYLESKSSMVSNREVKRMFCAASAYLSCLRSIYDVPAYCV